MTALVKAVLRVRIGQFDVRELLPYPPDSDNYPAEQARRLKESLLANSFLRSHSPQAAFALKLVLAIREATRFTDICRWDVERIEAALAEFRSSRPDEFRGSSLAALDEPRGAELDRLTGKPREAYECYLTAVEALGPAVTDDEAYEWVKDNLDDASALPARDAWKPRRPNLDDLFNELAPDLDIRTAPGAPEGQRHNRACALVGSALGRRVPLHRLTAYALTWGTKCEPPMSDEEILQIIEDLSDKDGEKLEDLNIGEGPAWPTVRPEAYYGLAGDIVRTIEPETEADPMALLLQFLAVYGTNIGRTAHYQVEATRHYGNLFAVIVGDTASARKGTSFDRVQELFKGLPAVYPPARSASGLNSGEGLIWQVRDASARDATRPRTSLSPADTQGVSDKRLIFVESEFASVFSVVKREGNTLSPVIREAWQSGNLDTLVKNAPARATNAHISIIGHITLHELRSQWPTVEGFNGFANRFLWAVARRSKLLPDGGRPLDLAGLQQRLVESIDFANQAGRLTRDEEASKLWRERYSTLGTGRVGAVASVIARAQPQVVRLSMLYALLDRSKTIRREHLAAAFAVWDYCEESAVYIFGVSLGNKNGERILVALRERCMTTKEIHRLFNNRLSGTELKACLEMLLSQRLVRLEKQSTGGRPSSVWHAV